MLDKDTCYRCWNKSGDIGDVPYDLVCRLIETNLACPIIYSGYLNTCVNINDKEPPIYCPYKAEHYILGNL